MTSTRSQLTVRLKELPLTRRVELGPRFVAEAIGDHPLVAALESPEPGDLGEAVAEIELYGSEGEHADVFARGSLDGRVAVACSRCIDRVEVEVSEPIAVSFVPASQVPEEDDSEDLAEDDEDVYPYEGESIDLTTLFRERLIMAVPFAPLCHADCKGLCPVCGAELNRGECGCDREVGDPRLAALRELAKKAKA